MAGPAALVSRGDFFKPVQTFFSSPSWGVLIAGGGLENLRPFLKQTPQGTNHMQQAQPEDELINTIHAAILRHTGRSMHKGWLWVIFYGGAIALFGSLYAILKAYYL